MFHIKTDIRQYKCESEQKVERLIRNWVIRPTDLIYDVQKDAWKSIGEHSAFHAIFVTIEKEEANEPDTVVTEAPSEVAAEFEVQPGSELADEVSDADQTLTFGKLAPGVASTLDEDSDYPAPPEAPEGVEGLIRDSDEITMMTDRTLDMLRDIDDTIGQDDASAQQDVTGELAPAQDQPVEASVQPAPAKQPDDPKGRHGLPEDVFVTDEIFREDIHASIRDDLKDLDDDPDGDAVDEDDEITQLVERDAFFDSEEEQAQTGGDKNTPAEDTAPLASTQEIGLAEQSEPSEDDGVPADEDDEKARWRIVVSEEQDPSHAPHEASAPEQDAEQADADEEGLQDYAAMDDTELDAMLNEAAALVGLGEGDSDPLDLDEPLDKDTDAQDLELLEVDGLSPNEEAQGRDRTKTPVRAAPDPLLDISGGYALPLPRDISPSAQAIKLGLVHSRLSREVKNATFPHAKPKKPGEISTRVFDLAAPPKKPIEPKKPKPSTDADELGLPPQDHSLLLVVGFMLFIVVTIIIAMNFS